MKNKCNHIEKMIPMKHKIFKNFELNLIYCSKCDKALRIELISGILSKECLNELRKFDIPIIIKKNN